MSKYPRKTIYFKADNVELYDYLEGMGKQASEYICQLIRDDMTRDTTRDTTATEELILEELRQLREDLKHVKIDATIPVDPEPQMVDELPGLEIDEDLAGGLLLDLD